MLFVGERYQRKTSRYLWLAPTASYLSGLFFCNNLKPIYMKQNLIINPELNLKEYRFQDEINHHIGLALPALHQKYGKARDSLQYEDGVLSYDMIYKMKFTISIRIFRNKSLQYDGLTIPNKSLNGGKTEIDKIMEGKAQMYFYAYMNEQETELIKIRMIGVQSIRFLYVMDCYTRQYNYDGTEFIIFFFDDIEKNMGSIYQYNKK